MSEITTGAVALNLIGAPLAVGAACIGAAHFAAQYMVQEFEKMAVEIEKSNTRLQWLDKQALISPAQMAKEAEDLQKMVAKHPAFVAATRHVSMEKRDILAGVMAMQHSPLKAYVPSLLHVNHEGQISFREALQQGTRNLALDNMAFVKDVVGKAAQATGFNKAKRVLKETATVNDVVFIDDQNRRFTAFLKLDKQLNPSLALDLEGFECNTSACSKTMDAIVQYLQGHGVPFEYKRLKHNQPMGILRKALQEREKRTAEISDYLTEGHKGHNKTKLLQNEND